MNFHWVDWVVVLSLFVFLCALALLASRYTKTVADFLAANRCAGRYVLSIGDGVSTLGAISIIAMWQMYYKNGFTGGWWAMMLIPVYTLVTITGYIVYKYRQTRAMTMAQFFEIRYSKNLRIFTGLLAFLSGTLNFGIFPAVGANFFIYFCGLPQAFTIVGITLKTFPMVMAFLLTVSLFFTWSGGQIAVIITDFFQGIFCNIVFIVTLVLIFFAVDWGQIGEALALAPAGESLVHPFKGGEIEGFNFWYYIIGAVGAVYGYMGWQGTQGYNCSAKTPHEAKMSKILSGWRSSAQGLMMLLLPVLALTLMRHPLHSDFATDINGILDAIGNEQIRDQMTVPVVLSRFLPIGLRGAMAAVMLAAFISTHDTYLHSWGSIFIQDVLMPFRKKPFGVKQHLWLLRFSILGVAIFIFCFALFFRQIEAILMFFAITGTIYLGGSGAVIIGGLYWKRGTTSGAWGGMIVGVIVAVAGLILQQTWPVWFDGADFPINGQWVWAVAMGASSLTYVALSLLSNKVFNLDRMLHRGEYKIAEDVVDASGETGKPHKEHSIILQRLGLSHEFSFFDKLIFWATVGWSMLWFVVFVIGTIYNLVVDVADVSWLQFWKIYCWVTFILSIVTTVWFTIGGLVDIKKMFHDLSSVKHDAKDDGMVVDHHNLNE